MLTSRKREEERTGVQTSNPYGGAYDLQSDFVMVYRLNDTTRDRIAQYKARGFRTHLMTGVSWGEYADYLNGEYDGRTHWDDAQVRMDGQRVMHSQYNPYMIPSIPFTDYLSHKLRAAVDAGVDTVHLEEPEIWSFSGYGEGFKREYETYYKEPWQPPHESADAYYRAGKLKAYLYARALGRIADSIKDYALRAYNRRIRFIVPTHSLINYTQYGISSPESMLIDLPGVDGYIAQVWTGTSRVENVYRGVKKERVFECAFLEYGIMQELARGTGRDMWFLQDPIDDNPNHPWAYYRACYLEGLTAALLQPHVSKYEICPWPHRVLTGKYPKDDGRPMPDAYLTTLLTCTQALRDMDQPFEWIGDDACVGILLSDTMLYQRTYGYGYNPGTEYAEFGQESNASGFYGMALPLLARGIRAQPVQFENIRRFSGYLAGYHMLCLSYEFMKPESPDAHAALAGWVREGGALILVGDGSDPFHKIRHWWNQGGLDYANPMQHLTDALGLGRSPAPGVHAAGKGFVAILPCHPAKIAYERAAEDEFVRLLFETRRKMGLPAFRTKNYFALRRGPYVIAAALRDSEETEAFHLRGKFVNLADPDLGLLDGLSLNPGEYCLCADVGRSRYPQGVCLVASAGRVEDYAPKANALSMRVCAPDGAKCALRLKGPRPAGARADGHATDIDFDAESGTFLVRAEGRADGVRVEIFWNEEVFARPAVAFDLQNQLLPGLPGYAGGRMSDSAYCAGEGLRARFNNGKPMRIENAQTRELYEMFLAYATSRAGFTKRAQSEDGANYEIAGFERVFAVENEENCLTVCEKSAMETDAPCLVRAVTGTTEEAFCAYVQALQTAGLRVVWENRIEGNRHCALASENRRIFASFFAKTGTARFADDAVSAPIESLSSPAPETGAPLRVCQFALTYGKMIRGYTADCGMLYILALPDGSLFVMDGGELEQATDAACGEAVRVMRALSGAAEGQPVRVAAWFCTHAHDDHMDLFAKLLRFHHDELRVERVIFNFPAYEHFQLMPQTYILLDRLRAYCPGARYLKPHAGQALSLAGVRFTFLQTHEDSAGPAGGEVIGSFNDTSTILKVEFAGQTLLFLGDMDVSSEAVLLSHYGAETLKCDFVQVSHHLINRLEKLYPLLQSPVALIPQHIRKAVPDNEKYVSLLRYLRPKEIYFASTDTSVFKIENGCAVLETRMPAVGGPCDGSAL